LFADTGIRRAELAGLTLHDVVIDAKAGGGEVRVFGKGGRYRSVPFGAKTAIGLRRYLREREKVAKVREAALWVSNRGPLSGNGVLQMLRRRGDRVGLPLCSLVPERAGRGASPAGLRT
jgi:site-specific recombinase XerD